MSIDLSCDFVEALKKKRPSKYRRAMSRYIKFYHEFPQSKYAPAHSYVRTIVPPNARMNVSPAIVEKYKLRIPTNWNLLNGFMSRTVLKGHTEFFPISFFDSDFNTPEFLDLFVTQMSFTNDEINEQKIEQEKEEIPFTIKVTDISSTGEKTVSFAKCVKVKRNIPPGFKRVNWYVGDSFYKCTHIDIDGREILDWVPVFSSRKSAKCMHIPEHGETDIRYTIFFCANDESLHAGKFIFVTSVHYGWMHLLITNPDLPQKRSYPDDDWRQPYDGDEVFPHLKTTDIVSNEANAESLMKSIELNLAHAYAY